MLYFLFASLLIFAFIILLRFSLVNALIGCLLLVPFSGNLTHLGSQITISRLFLFPFLIVFLFGIVRSVGRKFCASKLFFIAIWFIFTAVTVIKGSLLSGQGAQSVIVSLISYGYFIVGVGIVLFDEKVNVACFSVPLMLGGIFLAFVGLAQMFFPEWASHLGIPPSAHFDRVLPLGLRINGRINGLHGNPNAAAIYYGIAALSFEWFAYQKKGVSKIFIVLGFFLCAFCLLLTFSRAGCLSLILCATLQYFLLPVERRKGWVVPLIGILMFITMVPILLSARKFGATSDLRRLSLWKASVSGTESGFFEFLIGRMGPMRINVHNGLLQIFYEYGILGFSLYLSLIGIAIYHCIVRIRERMSYPIILCVIFYFILIDIGHSCAISSVIYWVFLAGAILTLKRTDRV